MFCAVFQSPKVSAQCEAYREMSQHPFFEDEADEFRDIEKLFATLRTNGNPED